MDNIEFFSYKFLDEVLALPQEIRDLYRKSLSLIINTGMESGQAFQETGFEKAYKEHKQTEGTKQ